MPVICSLSRNAMGWKSYIQHHLYNEITNKNLVNQYQNSFSTTINGTSCHRIRQIIYLPNTTTESDTVLKITVRSTKLKQHVNRCTATRPYNRIMYISSFVLGSHQMQLLVQVACQWLAGLQKVTVDSHRHPGTYHSVRNKVLRYVHRHLRQRCRDHIPS